MSRSLPALIFISILISVLISVFNSYYFSSAFKNQNILEYTHLFNSSEKNFSETAIEVLNSRQDVVYVQLLDPQGFLLQSFGGKAGNNTESFPITTPESNTILLGLVTSSYKSPILYSAFYGVLIGIAASTILLFVFSFLTKHVPSLDSENDASEARIPNIDKVSKENILIELDENGTSNEIPRSREEIEKKQETGERISESVLLEVEEEPQDHPHHLKNFTVLVASITDFNEFSSDLSPLEFNSFLISYRKEVSRIISDYGGFVETFLKNEIIAFFNASKELDKLELRAVCSAVEMLQYLASVTREKNIGGKRVIGGKVGICLRRLEASSYTGMPQGIKKVTEIARSISKVAPVWKIIVSQDVFNAVHQHVEAKELKFAEGLYYSITKVESGIV